MSGWAIVFDILSNRSTEYMVKEKYRSYKEKHGTRYSLKHNFI